MQIGKGKQGVIIEEIDPASGFLGCVSPACDESQWIMWFDKKGNVQLYTERDPSGAVIGDPIRIKAKGQNHKPNSHSSISGNMEVGRIKINGEDHLTIKVDKNGGNLKWVWPDGDIYEIKFGSVNDGKDYDGRDPEQCVRLEGRTQNIILVNPLSKIVL